MIPMSLGQAVKDFVKPHLTKETKATPSASFQLEGGTLSFSIAGRVENGVPVPTDLTDIDSVKLCRVKSVKQQVKNANVTLSESYTKLADGINKSFALLLDHANTLATPVSGS